MPGRPVLLGAVAWIAVLAIGRVAVAPTEHCPTVDATEVRSAADAAAGWLTRNQLPDGQWLYRYDRVHDTLDDGPQLVRHAGVTMSLYQADAAGITGTRPAADRGADWALDQLVDTDGPGGGAQAVQANGAVPTGATALLTAGLAVRRQATGDPRYDDDLDAMGRFLVSMIEPSGAVLAAWDPTTREPVPGGYSSFYTGEALWALSMLATVDPTGGWVEPAERVAHYIATDRDTAEHRFPPVADHWGAYGIAQLTAGAGVPLPADQRAYIGRLAGIFGSEVRTESQRAGRGISKAIFRRGQASGAGLGTIGEGLGNLYRIVDDLPGRNTADVVAQRINCAAGILVDRQVDATDAATTGHPDAAAGAWFRDGVTQKDDQQHAMSALLLAAPAVDRGFAPGRSAEDASVARVGWLALVAVATLGPIRRRAAAPDADDDAPDPDTRRPGAAVGTGVSAAALVAIAFVASPFLRAIDVSPATAALAVGVLVAVTAIADLLDRPAMPATIPQLVFLRPAPAAAVLAIAAFVGIVPAVLAAVAVALVAAAAPRLATTPRVLTWLVPAVAVVGGIDLLVHGVLAT